MAYRNNPFRPGKYTYPNVDNPEFNDLSTESLKITDEIPLPNNIENIPGTLDRKPSKHPSSIIDFFKDRIALEEIILIGVIVILFLEGVEDEFLLLMLAYVLIF